jgi:hypothetical protein
MKELDQGNNEQWKMILTIMWTQQWQVKAGKN